MTMPPAAFLNALVAALLLAVFPLPYGYYQLLRLVTFGLMAWYAVASWSNKRTKLVIGLSALLAALYNPFIRVHFDRDTWSAINVLTATIVAVLARSNRTKRL